MNLGGINVGDIVRVNRGGRMFYAHVTSKEAGKLGLLPMCKGITYYSCTAREVSAHFRKAGRRVAA